MAFVTIDGRPDFDYARRYYEMFPREMTKAGNPIPLVLPPLSFDPDTFQALVYCLAMDSSRRKDKDAVVVTHGLADTNDNPVGLGLPLNELTNVNAEQDIFYDLDRSLNNRMDYKHVAADAEAERRKYPLEYKNRKPAPVRIEAGALEAVFNVLVQIRYQELNRVELRACSLGKNPDALKLLGCLLGVKFISAPDSHMFYARINPGTSMTPGGFGQWVSNHRGARVFRNPSDPKDAVGIRILGTGVHRESECATTSKNLNWFFGQFVFRSPGVLGASALATGFVLEGIDHTSPGKPFVLPLEPEFRGHLVEIGPLPSLEPWLRGHDAPQVKALPPNVMGI